jgi:hypothetical protein
LAFRPESNSQNNDERPGGDPSYRKRSFLGSVEVPFILVRSTAETEFVDPRRFSTRENVIQAAILRWANLSETVVVLSGPILRYNPDELTFDRSVRLTRRPQQIHASDAEAYGAHPAKADNSPECRQP